ncbi:MAG: biotin-dependent carboxyltransferase family protein [Alphaproteobacteria bacterium]|nr:biotin-dependent carboxyltransferase family protein [Alphaproteobacteria bacterium]
MLVVTKPGLQSTLQAAPRIGYRHFGVPYAGPADELSHALANRLVGNTATTPALEITFGGFEAEVETECSIAVTGAYDQIHISGQTAPAHTTLHLKSGDRIEISPVTRGTRTYLAIATGFQADEDFGSKSTYLPAQLGGLDGRALKAGDRLKSVGSPVLRETLETPVSHRPVFAHAVALRACASAETDLLDEADRKSLFEDTFTAGRQATRMGVTLTGRTLSPMSDGQMKSAPVFPGTIQCPPSGTPVVLLCDAQTTGGYPRIGHIARCDRHLLGQIRPGDQIKLLQRRPEDALRDYAEKRKFLDTWLKP